MSVGTTRCVRKIVPPQPWQRMPIPTRGPLTERWLALAGSWSTEQAVRQLFSRRCGSTLQLESITAVCHETSLTAFNAGSSGPTLTRTPIAYPTRCSSMARAQTAMSPTSWRRVSSSASRTPRVCSEAEYTEHRTFGVAVCTAGHAWPLHVSMPLQQKMQFFGEWSKKKNTPRRPEQCTKLWVPAPTRIGVCSH